MDFHGVRPDAILSPRSVSSDTETVAALQATGNYHEV